jgi:sugar phosphate isomerase/epimerase
MNIAYTINLDEFGQDLDISIRKCQELGIQNVELRSINNKNLLDFTNKEIFNLSKKLSTANLKPVALASPVFKWFYFEETSSFISFDSYYFEKFLSIQKKKKYIFRTFEIASMLKIPIIRVFSYIKDDSIPISTVPELFKDSLFKLAISLAKKNSLSLYIENEPICLVRDADTVNNLIPYIKDSPIKVWFDISNFFMVGDDLSKTFLNKILPFTDYIQFKDFSRKENFVYVPLMTGDVPYENILNNINSFYKENDTVFFNVETHIEEDKDDAIKESFKNLRNTVRKISSNTSTF